MTKTITLETGKTVEILEAKVYHTQRVLQLRVRLVELGVDFPLQLDLGMIQSHLDADESLTVLDCMKRILSRYWKQTVTAQSIEGALNG